MLKLPNLYFRRKGAGAVIYRTDTGQQSRLDMQQIAILKPNGEVKPHGKHTPTDTELNEIANWYSARALGQPQRDAANLDELVTDMNAIAQWLQSNATDSQIKDATEPLLMAIHDLRSTLVRCMTKTTKED